jgi:hypothetical protein
MKLPEKDLLCHLTGFTKSCRHLVSEGACGRWRDLPVNNPNTGTNEVLWDCIDNHAHILRHDLVRCINSNSASIESMRNESKKAHDEQVTMAAIAVHRSTEAVRDLFLAAPPVASPMALTDERDYG